MRPFPGQIRSPYSADQPLTSAERSEPRLQYPIIMIMGTSVYMFRFYYLCLWIVLSRPVYVEISSDHHTHTQSLPRLFAGTRMTDTSEQAGCVRGGSGVGIHNRDEWARRLNQELAIFASGPKNDTVGPTESDHDLVFSL